MSQITLEQLEEDPHPVQARLREREPVTSKAYVRASWAQSSGPCTSKIRGS